MAEPGLVPLTLPASSWRWRDLENKMKASKQEGFMVMAGVAHEFYDPLWPRAAKITV